MTGNAEKRKDRHWQKAYYPQHTFDINYDSTLGNISDGNHGALKRNPDINVTKCNRDVHPLANKSKTGKNACLCLTISQVSWCLKKI